MSKEKTKKKPEATATTDSDKKFSWTGEHQDAFDKCTGARLSRFLKAF